MRKSIIFILGMVLMGCLSFAYQEIGIEKEPHVRVYEIRDAEKNYRVHCAVVTGYPGGGIDCDWETKREFLK